MVITRRALLVGAGGLGVVAATGAALEWPAVHRHLDRMLHPVPEPAYSIPEQNARIVSGSFVSAARQGQPVGWSIAYPATRDPALPVAIVLHGRGDDHSDVVGDHAWGHYLAAAVADGLPPFAVAAVDGGDHGYWHRRADGDDPQQMLLSEFLPLLGRQGLRTDRFGLAGWSMGGYGALLLAERVGPGRCAAVAVDSPALWTSADQTAPGAFDDAADYERNDVFAGRSRLREIPVRIAIGTSDPFYPATRTFVAGMHPRPVTSYSPGGHDLAFWRHSAPQQIAFLGHHLSAS